MQVLDFDEWLGKRGFWPQEAAKPGPHEASQPVAGTLLGVRQEFRVMLTLPPFPQAAARLFLFLQDVQALLHEDLHDLHEPLLACQIHAQTTEQRAVLDLITSEVARLDEILSQHIEVLKGYWQRGMAVIADDRAPVVEQEIAVPGEKETHIRGLSMRGSFLTQEH